jgi:hypothetical protein
MNVLDLFNTVYERALNEGAVDDLEARYIHGLNTKMLDLMARTKESQYQKNPAALAGLKREYEKIKSERDSFYKIREGSVTPTATGLRHQAKPGTYGGYEPEPELKGLNKTLTKNLEKGMGIEFKKGGQHNRIQPDVDEGGIPGNIPTEKIPGKEDLLKGKGRTYYEDQKKSSETVDEHGGGIGPKQRWQDLMPEQSNPEDDDWYDDEDEDLRLRSGDYVRDTQDGEYGEVFRMQGDPEERRVRILDRDGKGWYIEPSRLTRVDPQDPDVQRYFGKKRVRDMDEEYEPSPVAGAIVRRIMFNHPDLLKQYGPNLVNAAVDNVADYVGDVDEIGSSDVSAWVAQVERMLKENPPEAFAEGWSDAVVARRTGQPRTPYSVYIKGKKWKDFENDDHARAVMDKLKAKFKADGRDPETITIAPTDMSEGIKSGAAATALAACIAAGGTLSGCATNPSVSNTIGTVRDVGTAAKTASTMTRAGVQDELSQELRNFIRAQGGDPGSQNLSTLYKLQKRLQGKKDTPQNINEIKDTEAVEQAILKRIMVSHRPMLTKYGPEKIMTAASDVAYDVGDIGEIGSSDVSGWVRQVEYILGARP